jgi:hypothetical protein
VPYPRPAGADTYAQAINNSNTIAGYFRVIAGNGVRWRSFRRDPDGSFEFPIKYSSDNAIDTIAKGINNAGTIVGDISSAAGSNGFILSNGVFSLITLSPGSFTSANGINDHGDIVGNETYFDGANTRVRGYLMTDGNVTSIQLPGVLPDSAVPTAIARNRTVVGSFFSPQFIAYIGFVRGPKGNYSGFRFPQTPVILPGGINSVAGKIVGTWFRNRTFFTGFVYDYASDVAVMEGPPDTPAINAGASSIPVRTVSAETVHVPGSDETQIFGINAHGVITGHCKIGKNIYGFIGTPVAK